MRARSRYGRVNVDRPEAAARCDRGGEIRKRSELIPEMRWSGNALIPTGFLCCPQHCDALNPGDRVIVLQADPVPVQGPRTDIDVMAAEASLGGIPLLVSEEESLLTSEGEEFLE